MRTDQREPILVIANLFERDLPAFHGVATLAIGSELTAMNIGVTICARGADFFEDQAGVALGARNLGVHAAQGVAGLVVIELGIGADRFPACVTVTLLARSGDGPVRVGDLCLRTTDGGLSLLCGLLSGCAKKQRPNAGNDENEPARAPHRISPLHPRLRQGFRKARANAHHRVIPRTSDRPAEKRVLSADE